MTAQMMALGTTFVNNGLRLLHQMLLKLSGDIDIIRHMHVGKLSCGADSGVASHPNWTAQLTFDRTTFLNIIVVFKDITVDLTTDS